MLSILPLTVKLDCAVLGILGGDTGLGIELVAEHDHLLGQTLRGRSGIQVQLARVDGDGDSLLGLEALLVHGGVGDAVLAVFVGVECIALDYRLILDTGVGRNTVNGYGDLLGRGCTALVSCRIGNVIVAGRIGLNGTLRLKSGKVPCVRISCGNAVLHGIELDSPINSDVLCTVNNRRTVRQLVGNINFNIEPTVNIMPINGRIKFHSKHHVS